MIRGLKRLNRHRQDGLVPGGQCRTFIVSAIALVALAGCTSATSSNSDSPEKLSGMAGAEIPEEPTSPGTISCESLTGDEVLGDILANVSLPTGVSGDAMTMSWAPHQADTSSFDGCAELSWIVLPVTDADHHSPHQLLLFHRGEFIGPATAVALYSEPIVDRRSKSSIDVTWTWGGHDKDGEHANVATSTFEWDRTINSLVREGDLPPVAQD